jgi:hypothetical protein
MFQCLGTVLFVVVAEIYYRRNALRGGGWHFIDIL